MSTPTRAWVLGASCSGAVVAFVNDRLITSQQRDMLLSLRRALLTEEVRRKHALLQFEEKLAFPLFSRETLNLAIVAISDRFIFSQSG